MDESPCPQFQSLIGFKINWNLKKLAEQLQDYGAFQSLIGFKINWNACFEALNKVITRFQSLIGFKINWNRASVFPSASHSRFQSLIGFKINWNEQKKGNNTDDPRTVSIPNRV